MEKLLNLRQVITSQITYLASIDSKAEFVSALRDTLRIPLFESDRLIEDFNRTVTSDTKIFDDWLNYLFQIETELVNRQGSLDSFADFFNQVIKTQVPGGDGITHAVNPHHAHNAIILATRVYLDCIDKDALDGKENE